MRNIVLICIDTVRKDYFDEYMPRLQEAADVSFPQCRAASIWSAPSHASMLTGQLAHKHGVHARSPSFEGISREETFFSELERYHKIGISSNPYANSDHGFERFFDEFVDVDPYSRYPDGLDLRSFIFSQASTSENPHTFVNENLTNPQLYWNFVRESLTHESTLKSLANGAIAAADVVSQKTLLPKFTDYGAKIIERESERRVADVEEPYFLFINMMDAHTPLQHIRGFDKDLHNVENTWVCNTDRYNPWDVIANIDSHDEYLENRRALYGAALDYLDRRLIYLMSALEALSDDETTFVITSDHGENLGYEDDDRLVMHKSSMTEGVLHVPLCIVNAPVDYDETELISHLQLPSLIHDIATEDQSFNDAETVAAEVIGLNSLTDTSKIEDYEYWNRMIRCVYRDDEKVVWDSLGEVDRYRIDPAKPGVQQQIDEDSTVPDWATQRFETPIDEFKTSVEAGGAANDMDAEVEDRLRKLGYV